MNIDEIANTLELIKQTLSFYAEDTNYENIHLKNGEYSSKIEMDKGNLAKFAIKKIEDLNKYMDGLQNFEDMKSFEINESKIEEFIKKSKSVLMKTTVKKYK